MGVATWCPLGRARRPSRLGRSATRLSVPASGTRVVQALSCGVARSKGSTARSVGSKRFAETVFASSLAGFHRLWPTARHVEAEAVTWVERNSIGSTGCITATVASSTSPSLTDLTGTPIAVVTTVPHTSAKGYLLVTATGAVSSFGAATAWGRGEPPSERACRGCGLDPDRRRVLTLASDCGISGFEKAKFYGSAVGMAKNPVVGIAVTPTGKGYALVSSPGAIYGFGAAHRSAPWRRSA